MKNNKRNKINLLFSSFLIIGYIVCTYFFMSLSAQVGGTVGSLIQVLVLALFGLLLFYATRVGDGKQIRRFSLAVLLLVDLPAAYIILATFVEGMPFHDQLAEASFLPVVFILACVALGYGIPYTFLSGYEQASEEDEIEEKEEAVLEGGLAEELAEVNAEPAEESDEINAEETDAQPAEESEEDTDAADDTAAKEEPAEETAE